MKEYKVNLKGIEMCVYQDDDGRFIIPEKIEQFQSVGTCLKPAFEPVIVARKPFDGSLVDNVLKYGVGGLNIDECRIYTDDTLKHGGCLVQSPADDRKGKSLGMLKDGTENTFVQNPSGRFPANLILTYDESDYDEVCGGFPTGGRNGSITKDTYENSLGKNGIYSKYSDYVKPFIAYEDSGSASRYFYCAKASKKDREDGLSGFVEKYQANAEFRPNHMEKALNGEDGTPYGRFQPRKNIHPSVKPVDLMQYLVRLVAPKGATILDPFMGSGSTGKAVMFENKERNAEYKFIGVELSEEYIPIAEARIKFAESFGEDGHTEKSQNTIEKSVEKSQKSNEKMFEKWGFDI